MSVIANLRVMLSGDDAELKKSFKKTNAQSKKWAKDIERRNARVKKSFSAIAGGMAVIGTALAASTLKAITHADELAKSAKSIGISTQSLQEYAYAAERSGVATSEMTKGLQKFNKNMGEAARGTGTGKNALEDLGISIRNNEGTIKDQETLLLEMTDAIASVESPMLQASLANDLFGRTGVKLLPLLKEGSAGFAAYAADARALGLVMSDETAAKAEVLNDKLMSLTKGLENKFYTALIEGADEHLPAIQRAFAGVEGSMKVMVSWLDIAIAAFNMIGAVVTKVTADVLNFGFAVYDAVAKGIEKLPAVLKKGGIHLKKGIVDMVNVAAKAGEKALSSAPAFLQKFFGFEGMSDNLGAQSNAYQSELDALDSVLDQIDEKFAGRDTGSLLVQSLEGTSTAFFAKGMEAGEAAYNGIKEGISVALGESSMAHIAGSIVDGQDPSDPSSTGDEDLYLATEATLKETEAKAALAKLEATAHKQKMTNMQKSIAMMGSMAEQGSALAKLTIVAQTAMDIGSILTGAEAAAMKALAVDPIAGQPVAASIRAQGKVSAALAGAAGATALAGQFHDGIDSVPNTGTYLLEKGERVVDSRLNGDLTTALANSNGGNQGTQNLTFAVQGVEDPDVINRVIQENRGDFESMLRQINDDRAGSGLV